MSEILVSRSKKVMFYGVPDSTGENVIFKRMKGFTDQSTSKNPKEYARQYVDELFEQTDVVGYSPSTSYGFDQYAGNTVHDDNGGTRAYIDRNGNFLTAGSIQCGSGGYVLPANANETQKIMFERPSNYEYAARMDLIRNSLRIYTYNRSGTYEQPFTLTLDDGIVSTSGGFYGPTLKYTGLWSGTLTSGSITLTNGMKYSALMIWGSPGSDSYKSMCVVPAGGLGAVQLTSNTAWIGFTTAASGNNITLTINGGSGKIYYVWGLVRHSA